MRGRANRPTNPRLPGVKNIIAVAAGKGGVGKSTVSTNLALALRAQGATVGLLDADVYGPSIPPMLGEPDVPPGRSTTGNKIIPAIHYGMKVISVGFFVERDGAVVWRGPMVHKLLQQFIEDVRLGRARLPGRRPAARHRRRAALAVAAHPDHRRGDGDDAAGGVAHRRREGGRRC